MNNLIENRKMRICLWLVKTLQNYKRLTLQEIREKWKDSEFYRYNALPRQTFVDYRNSTEELLGVEICCDRRTNEYYIAAKDDSTLTDWLISSFCISRLVQEQQDIRDRILLDAPPRGIEYIDQITDAFRHNYALEMTYQKFSDSEPYTCYIEPYCLKHDQQRWYLLARKDHRPNLQTFALDRIHTLTERKDCTFTPEKDFSPTQHFTHSFGVYVGQQLPVDIKIRAYGIGRDYLRTAPLHHSQKERKISNEVSDFTIFCRPTRDLMLHLLSQGADIEVLEPASLREEIAKEVEQLSQRYK